MAEPYWVWANEPTSDDEAMIYGVPPVVASLGLRFNEGSLVTTTVPLIEIERDADSQGVLTDNLIAAGTKGLLFSSRLRGLIAQLGIDNIQYFPTLIRNPSDGTQTRDYELANILGRVWCLDRKGSALESSPDDPDYIEFIESLALDSARIRGQDLFRLGEKAQVIIASARLKRACESAGITGIRFYAPPEFTL
jgi:uncharacterized protein DUF1629